MVREKEEGTIVQVYASDLSAIEWLLGKELAYLIVGLGEALVVMTVAVILFGLRFRGDPTTLFIGTLLYLSASVAFGLLVGARAQQPNRGRTRDCDCRLSHRPVTFRLYLPH